MTNIELRSLNEDNRFKMLDLLGIDNRLDDIIEDFAFLADYHREFHPANSGDVSQVLDIGVGKKVSTILEGSDREWWDLSDLESLIQLRADGRQGYRSQGISFEDYYEKIKSLAGRSMLITSTGAQLPAIKHTIMRGRSGMYLNVVRVDESAKKIQIIYGNREYGTIPSIETHVHLLANALSVREGIHSPATVHAHPFYLVTLGRHYHIRGVPKALNAVLYTQVEGLLRNDSYLVGVVPYYPSGSEDLVKKSMPSLQKNRIVLWMNHGVVVRAKNIRQGYTLMGYAEEAAKAALSALKSGGIGLPRKEIEDFLTEHALVSEYERLHTIIEDIGRLEHPLREPSDYV